jgi:hypothetical protein
MVYSSPVNLYVRRVRMANVSIKIDKSLFKMDKSVSTGIDKGLQEIGVLVAKGARTTKKFKDRTPALRLSIQPDKYDKKNKTQTVTAGQDYGLFLNDGTRYIKAMHFMENEGLGSVEPKMETIVRDAIGRQVDKP